MPVYEYLCEKCGHEFEREQRITEDPVRRCPSCRALKVKRLISQTSFVLKGGGWYSDLYSSSKPGKAKDAAESKPSPTSSDSSAKAESTSSSDSSTKKSSEKKPAA